MFKTIKGKIVITTLGFIVVGSLVLNTVSILDVNSTPIKKLQANNSKENAIKDTKSNHKNNDYDELDINSENNNSTNKYEVVTPKSENDNKNGFNEKIINNPTSKTEENDINKETQENTNSELESNEKEFSYDRTTTIYSNDNITLLRVEYYLNNKLTYYSVVEQFDASTKSYIEKIYECNRETNVDLLTRTDQYINGNLIKSY